VGTEAWIGIGVTAIAALTFLIVAARRNRVVRWNETTANREQFNALLADAEKGDVNAIAQICNTGKAFRGLSLSPDQLSRSQSIVCREHAREQADLVLPSVMKTLNQHLRARATKDHAASLKAMCDLIAKLRELKWNYAQNQAVDILLRRLRLKESTIGEMLRADLGNYYAFLSERAFTGKEEFKLLYDLVREIEEYHNWDYGVLRSRFYPVPIEPLDRPDFWNDLVAKWIESPTIDDFSQTSDYNNENSRFMAIAAIANGSLTDTVILQTLLREMGWHIELADKLATLVPERRQND
jgi:hypothetical protein